jgi:FAD/FMN-containing dehydrogenase
VQVPSTNQENAVRRRQLLKSIASSALFWLAPGMTFAAAKTQMHARVRPGDAGWPTASQWQTLKHQVGGRLAALASPFASCVSDDVDQCDQTFQIFANPFAVGDDPALTQNLGWIGAWKYAPSAYVVMAESSADVAAAVAFARLHHLRVVVKGGGHSYQGTSSAPDSLLIWTRHMKDVSVHDAFIAQGAPASSSAAAVSLGAGALWVDAYNAVTGQHGRYVQGGGCTTVGVAGHVQSGGFGSFSKGFGTSACHLIEAEVVTADGRVRVVNQYQDSDLYWGIKGGGGGTLCVITRVTLATHALPERFGAVNLKVRANSDEAYQKLMVATLRFYRDHLANPNWGEQMVLNSDGTLEVKMLFQGIDKAAATAIWQPHLDWIAAQSDMSVTAPLSVLDFPAKYFWNAAALSRIPGVIIRDDRPNADPAHFVWAGDATQCGRVLCSYHSLWLSDTLLKDDAIDTLAKALVDAALMWSVELHFNKGLSGASEETRAKVLQTAAHPDVTQAFALAIVAGSVAPGLSDASTHALDEAQARLRRDGINAAARRLKSVSPNAGCYLAESDYFLADWQRAQWGPNYARLQKIKGLIDPEGMFFVHHGVGSEAWSNDGFTPLA